MGPLHLSSPPLSHTPGLQDPLSTAQTQNSIALLLLLLRALLFNLQVPVQGSPPPRGSWVFNSLSAFYASPLCLIALLFGAHYCLLLSLLSPALGYGPCERGTRCLFLLLVHLWAPFHESSTLSTVASMGELLKLKVNLWFCLPEPPSILLTGQQCHLVVRAVDSDPACSGSNLGR